LIPAEPVTIPFFCWIIPYIPGGAIDYVVGAVFFFHSFFTQSINQTTQMILLSMAKRFTFALTGDPARKLEEIRVAAARSRVTFEGNLEAGRFYGGFPLFGRINGTYKITGKSITVIVDEKPSLLSWDEVKSRLRGFIEG
jgi:hypothetical protein